MENVVAPPFTMLHLWSFSKKSGVNPRPFKINGVVRYERDFSEELLAVDVYKMVYCHLS